MPSYLLGLDVSTTGSKALLIDEEGRVVQSATNSHPLYTPRPAWSEQDPVDWWTASTASIRAVLEAAGVQPADVVGIGLTGQMHGLVLLDQAGEVLRPAILWNDQRTAAQCASITERVGPERVLQITGNPVLPGFTAPKIVWVKENEPQVYARVASFLLPKDYVRYRLTGALVCDVSDASGTSVFDVGRRTWSDEILEALEIPRSWVPEVTESPEVSARVSAEGARATGLLAGTPVVSGAGDNAAAAVGTGIIRSGIISASLGTSGVVFAPLESYQPEPAGRLHAFCHAVPGQWHLMGVMLSAAGSLRWYRDAITGENEESPSFDSLVDEARSVPAGSEGLLFLPYLSGERTPHPDPDARGAFVGLSLRHGRGHLTRAVMEGVVFGLKDSVELMKPLGLSVGRVRIAGGGARSTLWRQILADVLDAELATTDATEGAAYGAALLGGVGAGVFDSVEAASDRAVREVEHIHPGADVATYARFYERYRALYPALANEFHAMARLLDNQSS
ncbi:MAG TPA: xylulokinase [Longimicrobiaceae bacterium]